MSGISLKNLGSNTTIDELIPILKDIFQDLEEQLNTRVNLYVSNDGRLPTTLSKNDVMIVFKSGKINLYMRGGKNFTSLSADMLGGMLAKGSNFLGFVTKTSAPGLTDFPNANDWGFFTNSSLPATYLCANIAGSVKKTTLT